MDLSKLSDRELLEGIYAMLVVVLKQTSEIDNDSKQFFMNTLANLVADADFFNNRKNG